MVRSLNPFRGQGENCVDRTGENLAHALGFLAPALAGGKCINGFPGIDGKDMNGVDVCCPLECNQCGGVGCGSNGERGFGNKECCINGILNNQQNCSVSGAAPCIITDGQSLFHGNLRTAGFYVS